MKNYRDSDIAVNNASGIENTVACSVPSAEEEFISEFFDVPEQAAKERRRRKLAEQALDTLTETQRRRYILHHAHGLSTWEIAEREGVRHQSVVECLASATKKIKQFLENG